MKNFHCTEIPSASEKKTYFILPSKIYQNCLKPSVLLTDKLPHNPGEMGKVFQQNFEELNSSFDDDINNFKETAYACQVPYVTKYI